MSDQRKNAALVSLAAAIIIPYAYKKFGITLGIDDVAVILGGAPLAWHAVASAFERGFAVFQLYFPPPKSETSLNPTRPVNPAGESK